MKSIISAIYLFLNLLILGVVFSETASKSPSYTAEQLLPLLERYDLGGLAKLINKSSSMGAKEVEINFGHDFRQPIPFTILRVEDTRLLLQTKDKEWYIFSPSKPPSIERLVGAKTMSELVKLLAPRGNPGDIVQNERLMVLSDIEKERGSFTVVLQSAYLVQGRLVWTSCIVEYSPSETPRTLLTPFSDLWVTTSASSNLK